MKLVLGIFLADVVSILVLWRQVQGRSPNPKSSANKSKAIPNVDAETKAEVTSTISTASKADAAQTTTETTSNSKSDAVETISRSVTELIHIQPVHRACSCIAGTLLNSVQLRI